MTYSLIILNSLRLVRSSPISVIAIGSIVNLVLISAIVIELRKSYKVKKQAAPES